MNGMAVGKCLNLAYCVMSIQLKGEINTTEFLLLHYLHGYILNMLLGMKLFVPFCLANDLSEHYQWTQKEQ